MASESSPPTPANTNNLRRRKGKVPTSTNTTSDNVSTSSLSLHSNVSATDDNDSNDTRNSNDHPRGEAATASAPSHSSPAPSRASILVWLLLHMAACGVYIIGLVLQKELHSSVECSMTYSQRQLIPIPMSISSTMPEHPKYGLYKFVDQRDPRSHHQKMVKEWLKAVKDTGGGNYRQATNAYLAEKEQQHQQQHHDTPVVDNTYCAPPSTNASVNNNTATADTVAVLYIPGHWGSYMQSRSIGAHGIQLTGARDHRRAQQVIQALLASSSSVSSSSSGQPAWAGRSAANESLFTFDVYSLDFQEEGGAWHAQFLWAQTAFAAKAVQLLVKTCQLSQVIILGHSIGGYVSRLTPILYPETRPYIRSIVTLGSPHAYPVFGWETTLHQLHHTYLVPPSTSSTSVATIESEVDQYPHILVAISGGLRDEMIPPIACDTRDIPNSLAVLSPAIVQSSVGPNSVKPQIGMDHRAIVWCNDLLSVVRGVIYTLVQDNERHNNLPSVERLRSVKEYLGMTDEDESKVISVGSEYPTTSYAMALEEHQTRFSQLYGFGSVIALECAMLYHLEVLIGLFAVLGCLKSAGVDVLVQTSWWMSEGIMITGAICLAAKTTYEIRLLTLFTLTLVANFALEILLLLFGVIIPRILFPPSPDVSYQFYRIRFFALGLFLLLLGLQCVGKLFDWQSRFCLSLLCAIYIATINTAIVVTSKATSGGSCAPLVHPGAQREGKRLLAFASTFSLVCPSVVAGKVVALLSAKTLATLGEREIPQEFLPSTGLGTIVIRLLLPITLRLAWVHSQQKISTDPKRAKEWGEILRASLLGMVILYLSPSLFQMGQSYRSGDLIAAISWIECFCLPFAS